ncbi:MAG TPA: DUF4342 domain-containing protein [Paracoccaceae bacterium]|nr:DUF4342 domain-containing protein [Paracoccaceae bacterium]
MSEEGPKPPEEKKDHWKAFTEELEVGGRELIDEVKRLIAEGNVRRIRIRSQNDDVMLDVPVTAGAIVGGVVVLTAPWLAILGAIAGLLTKVRVEVAREDGPEEKDKTE